MEQNKPIISRFMNTLNGKPIETETPKETDNNKPQQPDGNPVRQQYRQTILNGLKGESYV